MTTRTDTFTHDHPTARLFLLASLLLVCLSAPLMQPSIRAAALHITAGVLLLFGWLALGVAAALTTSDDTLPVTNRRLTPHHLTRIQRLCALTGVVLLTIVMLISARHLTWLLPFGLPHDLQMLFFLGGMALIVVGFGGVTPRRPGRLTLSRGMVALLLVTLLALLLRLWRLDTAIHLFVDELNFARGVMRLWRQPNVDLLMPNVLLSFPSIYTHWQTVAVDVFGRNLFGLRVVSAVIGTLGIPALYLLGRTLFDRTTALIAALLLATFPAHLHFSRIGLNNIADPFVGVLALAFLARGVRHNRRVDYALAGVFLGATQYFYEGGRLLYPVLALLWLMWLVIVGRQRLNNRGLVIVGATALLVGLPLYYTLWAQGLPLMARMSSQKIDVFAWANLPNTDSDAIVLYRYSRQLFDPFLFYTRLPDASLFYGGATPLLLIYVTPAFLLGVFRALWRPRHAGLVLLLLTLLLTSLGNILIRDVTQTPRYVVTFPAICLLAAVGLRMMGSLLPGGFLARVTKNSRKSRAGLPLVNSYRAGFISLVMLIASGQAIYYFAVHVPTYNLQFRGADPAPDAHDAVFRAATFPPGTHLHFISDPPPDATYTQYMLNFFADDLTVHSYTRADLSAEMLSRLPHTIDHAFFIGVTDNDSLALLQSQFALEAAQFSPFDIPASEMYALYYARQTTGAVGTQEES